MEHYYGSIWTLYLYLLNWILISFCTFLIQYISLKSSFLPFIFGTCGCIGLYPMIFNLHFIEIALSFPSQINHIFGIFYIKSIYHPIIYCVLYNTLIRFDIATIISLIITTIMIYILPSIYHLSRYRIQKIQSSKLNIIHL